MTRTQKNLIGMHAYRMRSAIRQAKAAAAAAEAAEAAAAKAAETAAAKAAATAAPAPTPSSAPSSAPKPRSVDPTIVDPTKRSTAEESPTESSVPRDTMESHGSDAAEATDTHDADDNVPVATPARQEQAQAVRHAGTNSSTFSTKRTAPVDGSTGTE